MGKDISLDIVRKLIDDVRRVSWLLHAQLSSDGRRVTFSDALDAALKVNFSWEGYGDFPLTVGALSSPRPRPGPP